MVQQELMQAFNAVVQTRRSVRGFLAEPLPQQVLREVFQLAQTAPSNCNVQPWVVHVASGTICQQLKERLAEAVVKGEFVMDFPFDGKYEGEYRQRQYDAANQLYSALGLTREDKQGRSQAFLQNFQFFGAPHVAFLFLPEEFSIREAVDLGMYAQNLMLTMTAYGIASCPQTALSFHADLAREVLEVPASMKLLFGISFGYEDESNPANKARVGRADLNEVVKFHG